MPATWHFCRLWWSLGALASSSAESVTENSRPATLNMVKKAKKRALKELTRKQRSRMERERRTERLLILGVALVGVVVVGVLVYGFIVEKVVKAREAVAIVGDTPITTAEFQARVRFARMQVQNELMFWRQQQQTLDPTDPNAQGYLEYMQGTIRNLEGQLAPANSLSIGEQSLNELIQEELVRQEAERRGIAVTPEELQQEVERSFGYDRNPATPTPTPLLSLEDLLTPTPEAGGTAPLTSTEVLTPTPTSTPLPTPTPMTEAAFRERYNAYLKALKPLGVSEQQYRSWIEGSLLAGRLLEQFKAEAPTTAEQVKVRYLSVDSQERADELVGRLDGGEDLQTLLDEVTKDASATGYGSELDWLPKPLLERRLDAELADLAFSLGVGEHSQAVPSQDGTRYTIIEVVGREVRELEQSAREQVGASAFQEWLDAQMTLVERKTYQDRIPLEP